MIIIRISKRIFLCLVFALIFGTSKVYAESNIQVNAPEAPITYQNWMNQTEEEKNKSLMPSMYTVNFSDENINKISNIFRNIKTQMKVGSASRASSYDLRDEMYINVKNQEETLACWTFSAFSSMETNLRLNYGTSPDFSERHMDYATSQSFYDGDNKKGFSRKTEEGGSSIISLAYLTNGQGAVLEEQMPFENNTDKISINDIAINPSYYVKGYESFPAIYKYKDESGEIKYFDGLDKFYTEEQVQKIRSQVKEHIVNYGGIIAYTYATNPNYYNDNNIINATCYYCDDINSNVDHAITIIGWDDNYSKDNFTGVAKPSKDGAYLVLNSYSDKAFDNGCLWISYEDAWIEAMLYGITESTQINYDKLYQNDWFGSNVPITLTGNGENINEAYYASVYNREDAKKIELLTEVAVSTNQPARFEIYVNPNGDDLNPEKLLKVATTDILKSGYNTVKINPTILNGDKFAVVVKHTAVDDMFFLMLEAEIDNTFYDRITAEQGCSRVSLDGVNWVNLGELGHIDYSGMDIDLSKADVCIKAFTTLNPITTDEYTITHDNYITKIYDNTKINEFLNKISIQNGEAEVYNLNGEKVENFENFVTTGMTIKVNNIIYKLVVRGDLNGDGKISLVDLSKIVAHYAEIDGFILEGEFDKASDINLDGNVTLIDVSQLLLIFNNM